MTTTLTFQNTPLEMVTHDGVIWISAPELAKALEYKSPDAISRIYRRNADEFSSDMTETVKLTVSGNLQKETRIFSLRGAHLIAMFARSSVAKDFRKWVLNVLDDVTVPEILPYYPQGMEERCCMDEDELQHLIWCWYAAEEMRIVIKKLREPLYALGVPVASKMFDQSIDYKFYARDARRVILRLSEKMNIHYDPKNRRHYAFGEMLRNYSDRL